MIILLYMYIIIRLFIIILLLANTIEKGKVAFLLSVLYPFLFWTLLKCNSLLTLMIIWIFPIPILIFALKKCSKKEYYIHLFEVFIEYIMFWIPSAVNSASLVDAFSASVYFFNIYLFSL